MTKNNILKPYIFILGGRDLEMVTIKELLIDHGYENQIIDVGLEWSKAKDQNTVDKLDTIIEKILTDPAHHNSTCVLVELESNKFKDDTRVKVVNHHGHAVYQSSELKTIFQMIDAHPSQWSRKFELICANDVGYISGMSAINASNAEIIEIRDADRSVQGITKEEESAAIKAINARDTICERKLDVVTLPHSRCACVTDFLHRAYNGDGYRNLLVISDGEVNFFGDAQVIRHLQRKYPTNGVTDDPWVGGDMPRRGFWGSTREDVCESIAGFLKNNMTVLYQSKTIFEFFDDHQLISFMDSPNYSPNWTDMDAKSLFMDLSKQTSHDLQIIGEFKKVANNAPNQLNKKYLRYKENEIMKNIWLEKIVMQHVIDAANELEFNEFDFDVWQGTYIAVRDGAQMEFDVVFQCYDQVYCIEAKSGQVAQKETVNWMYNTCKLPKSNKVIVTAAENTVFRDFQDKPIDDLSKLDVTVVSLKDFRSWVKLEIEQIKHKMVQN